MSSLTLPAVGMKLVDFGPVMAVLAQPATELATKVIEAATARGLLLLRAGAYGNCIRVLVPLVIGDAELASQHCRVAQRTSIGGHDRAGQR